MELGQAVQEGASTAEQFHLLHESFVNLTDMFISDALRTIAFVMVAVGWIVASERSREFLRENTLAYWVGLAAVPVLAVIHVLLLLERHKTSVLKLDLLRALKYVPQEFYQRDGITPRLLWGNLILQVALFIALFLLVYAARRSKGPASSQAT